MSSHLLSVKDKEIREEYMKTLQDLTFNSKPLIDVLTEIAEENEKYASTISDCILEHLGNAPDHLKLIILYLIDSIIKRNRQHYMHLFFNKIGGSFTNIYQQGDETIRNKLLKLRFTWNGIVPSETLSTLDNMVRTVNPCWPNAPSVHVNPKFVSIANAHMTSINSFASQPELAYEIVSIGPDSKCTEKRKLDPRLCKTETQHIKTTDNSISSFGGKEAKITFSSSQIDPKIALKNGKQYQPNVQKKIVDSKAVTGRRTEVGVVRKKSHEYKSPKKNKDALRTIKNKEGTNHQEERNLKNILPTAKWSKEKRNKVMKALAETLSKNEERDNVIGSLSEKYPKITQQLLALMKMEKDDCTGQESKETIRSDAPMTIKENVIDRHQNISPKPTTSSSKITISTSLECGLSSSTVTSTVSISEPSSVAPPSPVMVPLAAKPFVSGVLPTLLSGVIPSLNSTAVSTLSIPPPPLGLPLPSLIPSPMIPTPPPAPIISSLAVGAESVKPQDIDYRPIFGFHFFQGSQVVTQPDLGKLDGLCEETEINNMNTPSIGSKKREVENKKHDHDVKRKRTDSAGSDGSVSSRRSVKSIDSSSEVYSPGTMSPITAISKSPSPSPLSPQFLCSDDISTSLAPFDSNTAVPMANSPNPPASTEVSSGPVADGRPENVNIAELLQTLMLNGLLSNLDNEHDEDDDVVKVVDFEIPSTLKQRQPAVIKTLYSGIQCDSCGQRFETEQTCAYGQHLDWHYRLNRKHKDETRIIHSRKWYYVRHEWLKFQEIEDNGDKGISWFEVQHPVTEYSEEILQDVPCIPSGSNPNTACQVCGDRFERFYSNEGDQWELRNAIEIEDLIYHPSCYQDHQEKSPSEKIAKEQNELLGPTETIKENEVEAQMNHENADSDIEDVQLIEKPIEEIVINDDGNDFDEPNLETLNAEDIIAAKEVIVNRDLESLPIKECDGIANIVGQEDEPASGEEEYVVRSPQTKNVLDGVVTMDGNIELKNSPAQVFGGPVKIKINISKTFNDDGAKSPQNEKLKLANNTNNSVMDTKLVPLCIKPRIEDAKLNSYPPKAADFEKSGLCMIM